ncbi:MAG TPA: tetratricopeptide repeat protein [Gemmataceae bacterium]|nr:tetratricopeptide repeat protein [Gemmataceae bacterium]
MRVLSIAVIGLAITAAIPDAQAMYLRPTLQEIPIAKLITNLENAAVQNPKDAKIRFNLARAHAMAYAEKVDNCQIQQGKDMNGVWFGFEPKFVPVKLKETTDQAKLKAAKEHLDKAVTRYEETVKLDPKNLGAKLGLAWCLDQSKKRDEAIKAYRDVIEEGWKSDGKIKARPLGGHTITVEAAGYLIPLLNPANDKQEIDTLKERVAKLQKLPMPITPVVVPLRDGLTAYDMVDSKARVRFDADGTGLKEEWTWFTKDAGILVFDQHGKRNITSARQWFGNVTFWMFWDNGYDALRALDANGDGVLKGAELEGIAVWVDANGDGVCQPGEVKSLAELGIVSISCRYEIDNAHPDRIAFSGAGVTFRNRATRPTFDVILHKQTPLVKRDWPTWKSPI